MTGSVGSTAWLLGWKVGPLVRENSFQDPLLVDQYSVKNQRALPGLALQAEHASNAPVDMNPWPLPTKEQIGLLKLLLELSHHWSLLLAGWTLDSYRTEWPL